MLIDVKTTGHQDEKLIELLVTMNAQREVIGQLPYETVSLMVHAAMKEQIEGWVSMADHDEVKTFSRTFEAADRAKRNAVMAILAPILPDLPPPE